MTFNSCKNFLNGTDLIAELEDSIEYLNFPVLNIELKSPPEKMGTISPAGTVSCKKKDSFDITFTKTKYCEFAGWSVLNGESASKAIEFTAVSSDDNSGVYKAKATVVENAENLSIRAMYTENFFINEQFPDNPRLVYPANSVIEIKFNYPLSDTENFKNYFTLKFADENFSSYYEIRFSEDNKEVYLVPYAEEIVNYMQGKGISSLIMNFALSENFYTIVGEGDDAKELPLILDEKYKFSYTINSDVDGIKPTTNSFSAYRKYDGSYDNALSVLSTTELGVNNHIRNCVKIKGDFSDNESGVKCILIRDTLTNNPDGSATNNSPSEWTQISQNFTDFEYELTATQNGLVKIEFTPVDYSGNRGDIQSFEVVRDVKTEIADLKVYNYEIKNRISGGSANYCKSEDLYISDTEVFVKSSDIFSNPYTGMSVDKDFFVIDVASKQSDFKKTALYSDENNEWKFPTPPANEQFIVTVSDKIGNAIESQYIIPPKPEGHGIFIEFGINVDMYMEYPSQSSGAQIDGWDLKGQGYCKKRMQGYAVNNKQIRSTLGDLCSVSSEKMTVTNTINSSSTQCFDVSVTYEMNGEKDSNFNVIYKLNNAEEMWEKYNCISIGDQQGGSYLYFVFENGSNVCTTQRHLGYMLADSPNSFVSIYGFSGTDGSVEKQDINLPKMNENKNKRFEYFSQFDFTKPDATSYPAVFKDAGVGANGIIIVPFSNVQDTGTGVAKLYLWTNECSKKVYVNPSAISNGVLNLPLNDFDCEKSNQIELFMEVIDGNNNSTTVSRTLDFVDIPVIELDTLDPQNGKVDLSLATTDYVQKLYTPTVYIQKLAFNNTNKKWEWTKLQGDISLNSDTSDEKYMYYTETSVALDENSFYRIITKAGYQQNDEYGFSEPEYFNTFENNTTFPNSAAWENYWEHPESFTKNDYYLSGDNGVLVHSDYPVMLFTVATSKPYSECKDWGYEKWLHRRYTLKPEVIDFTSGESGYKLYKTPFSEIQDGQCYVTFIYYAFQDQPVLTPVKQKN